MYRLFFPLCIAALGLPAFAQTPIFSNVPTGAPSSVASRLVEPAATLTLQNALGLAANANAELSAARHEFQAVDASVIQAGKMPNPTLELGIQDTQRATRETTVLISQPIELGGKRSMRIRAAESGRDAASAELHAKTLEIRANVTTAFFDVLTAQERLYLAQDSVELAQRATTTAAKRVIAGKVSPVEETKARVAEAGVRLELLKARGELGATRKRLTGFWGNLVPRFERAKGQLESLPELPEISELSRRLAAAPMLVRARIEVDRRQALANVERSRRIPDVSVNLGVKRSEELGRNQAIFGVSVPLPLFDRNQGNVLETLRRTDKARDELFATETRLDSELAQAYEKLNTSRQEAEALQKEILPGAKSAYDAAVTGFEFGKFAFLDVLDAQRTLLQTKSQYLRALSDAHRAAAEIDGILGEPARANTR
jgi:cobalt-zinc-cadmium efflux system outer membrane protein